MSNGKFAVITGASSGVGFEAARALARDGFAVVALGRDPQRIEASRRTIEREAAGAQVTWLRADFAVMAEVRLAAQLIAELTDRIDVLINNAGQILGTRTVTVDGLEQTFAGNVLAPFLLTGMLLPLLTRVEQPHVITVASVGHSYIDDMCWDDLQFERGYDEGGAYLQSKLANIIFACELARRHAKIVSSSVHPGTVTSNFVNTADERTKAYFAEAEARGETVTPEQAADTLVYLARDAGTALPSGGYFHERRRIEPSAAASSAVSGSRLWKICEEMTSISY